MPEILTLALVAVAGGVGAALRYLLDLLIQQRTGGTFPFGTIVVNVTGSFLLGLLTASLMHEEALRVAGVGLLGGYTTFSAASLDAVTLIKQKRKIAAICYAFATLFLSISATILGMLIGRLAN